jgi:rhodanese-related sulfurtransferase/DNA-binding transcriptional ArsR family regulator
MEQLTRPPRPRRRRDSDPGHRQLKDPLYAQFARIGHALSAPKRVELLDLLAQGERTVSELAEAIATPIKNTSAHLRVLLGAGLVQARRNGLQVIYRPADASVHDLVRHLQEVAHARYAEVERVSRTFIDSRDELEPITLTELDRRLRDGSVTLIDVRPPEEFAAGHIPGAISMPLERLARRSALAKSREVIAYCRGRYCVYAVEAVEMLRKRGYRARRFEGGLPGWRAEGRRVVTDEHGSQP